MIVSVRSDIARFARTLDELGRKQLPFAMTLAINQTARLAQQRITQDIPAIFAAKGAPTPFTRRAIGMTGARKSNLRALVFVKREQAKYLGIEETGATITPRAGRPILTPVDAKLNAYGNMPRGMVRRLLLNRKRYFLGTVHGVYGVWERLPVGTKAAGARRLRLVAAMRERASYKPRFGFRERIGIVVRTAFMPALEAGMKRAIATARRD